MYGFRSVGPAAWRVRHMETKQLTMDRSRNLRRPSARDETKTADAQEPADIFDVLRERIVTQAIAPGAKLLEQEVAAEFKVSRTRVREILRLLEIRGLIRREPNRGAIVVKLELPEVFQIYDVREALEGLCFRLATQNAPKGSWDDMVELFGPEMERKLAAGEIEAYGEALPQLHRRVIEQAANPTLARMLDSIYEKTRNIMRRVHILPGRPAKGLKEHQAVLAAMQRGDADEADRLKRLNIRSAISDLRRYREYVF